MPVEFDRDTILLLGRLEGKVDSLLAQNSAILGRVERVELRTTGLESWRESLAEVADRIESLEKWKTTILGGCLALTTLAGTLAWFGDKLLAFLH